MLGVFTVSCLQAWLFAFHVCPRGIRFHLDFVFCTVECHRCHSLTQQLLATVSIVGWHSCQSWLASCLLLSLSTDPVLQVPTHVAEYVSLELFSACVNIPVCTAPVCNKRWWKQMDLVNCWACRFRHSLYWSQDVSSWIFTLDQPFCLTPTMAACTLWEGRTTKASQ